jgi:hypothetical protein
VVEAICRIQSKNPHSHRLDLRNGEACEQLWREGTETCPSRLGRRASLQSRCFTRQ